jgi:replicative DNA helicase
MMRLEDKIIAGLIFDEDYTRKVMPFIKAEYFEARNDQVIVKEIIKFFSDYNKLASKDIIEIEVLNRKDISQKEAKEIPELLNGLVYNEKNTDWLLHETEKFFQKRAVFIAILNSIQIIEGNDTKHTEDAIPSLLQEALAVTFDMQVGHDYLEDSDARYDFYNKKEEGIKFDLDLLNRITGGVGLRKSTLTAIASKTGGGKSLMMCHISAATLMQGKNVLYITMEMSEERIAERIDANLFNTPIQNLRSLDKATFDSRVQRIRDKTQGRLVVKEYPTGSAHAGHFRALIEELKAKKNFIPDLVVIDYLNICSSQRIRNSSNANSYTIIKSIAEEIRAIAQEYKFPILTATQLNRGGIDSSDVEMTDTSESIGLVHSLDLYLALIRTEELDQLNQVLVKQLKNRYGDPNMYKRFVVGLDASRMKFYDVEQSAQKNISDSGKQEEDDAPMFDNSKFGKRLKTEGFIF